MDTTYRTTGFLSLLLLATVLTLIGMMALQSLQTELHVHVQLPNLIEQSMEPDWSMTTANTDYMIDPWSKQLVDQSIIVFAAAQWAQLPAHMIPSDFPNPEDFCNKHGRPQDFTKQPCMWNFDYHIKDDGTLAYRIRLTSGKYKVAEYEINEVIFEEYPEIMNAISRSGALPLVESETGWISFASVAEFTRRLGMGSALWEVGNQFMKSVSGGSRVVGIFADATPFRWGYELLSRTQESGGIEFLTKAAQNVWLYLVP